MAWNDMKNESKKREKVKKREKKRKKIETAHISGISMHMCKKYISNIYA